MKYDELTKREIGQRLRFYREQAGLTTDQLANTLGCGQSRVSKIELGMLRPTVGFVKSVVTKLRIPKPDASELVSATQSLFVDQRPWHVLARNGLRGLQQQAHEREQRSKSINTFQLCVIPGLLQTPEYARAVLALSDTEQKGDLDEAVTARMQRQTILADPNRHFTFVIAESAFRFQPVSDPVMQEQLHRLLKLSKNRNVVVGILPFEQKQSLAMWHSFTILDQEVRIETLTHAVRFEDRLTMERYKQHFDHLLDHSLIGSSAEQFLRQVGRKLRSK